YHRNEEHDIEKREVFEGDIWSWWVGLLFLPVGAEEREWETGWRKERSDWRVWDTAGASWDWESTESR
ncbi:hypothetical protein BaRGS_00031053, partial [Batillaria attramentaria]